MKKNLIDKIYQLSQPGTAGDEIQKKTMIRQEIVKTVLDFAKEYSWVDSVPNIHLRSETTFDVIAVYELVNFLNGNIDNLLENK